jgi:hypothetical protein
MNVYQENGYKNRKHYLMCLAEDYDIAVETVFYLAGVLGKDEDFDGLVNRLDDLMIEEWNNERTF